MPIGNVSCVKTIKSNILLPTKMGGEYMFYTYTLMLLIYILLVMEYISFQGFCKPDRAF